MTTWYACGCDPSGGGADQFAWAIGHWDADRIIVDVVEAMGGGRTKLDPKVAVAACAARCRAYQVYKVLGDRYAGQWPVTEFRAVGMLYEQSPKDKAALYLEMLPLFTAGRIEIPDDRALVRQTKLLERIGAGRGRDRIDHVRGGHDDLINSIGLLIGALGPVPSGQSHWAPDPGMDPRAARESVIESRVNRFQARAGTPLGEWWSRRR